ncbi:alpha/beta fold hydrolase [Neptunicoccus cionae]|uniref:HTH luxR-type domain-containing protein n=1 Tax=Neptunicoccus cionae TaxID=2035344 RepID=A0A916VNA9_9RHOB|nr:alpha/beta fold hydrolase [Amylibacter cionae]GGA11552.1 hypothetical protein GCM10011498_09750 [Amylibacter cionae]
MNSEFQQQQEIRFVTSKDGTRIATATIGRGPIIVRAAHWLTHVSRDPESPIWRHWIAEMSAQNRLVRYDLRGCGLSARDVCDISFEAWLADLEAVTQQINEPFTLIGMSQGAALSIAYALRHPEKVERLILIGGYVQGIRARASEAQHIIEADTLTNLIRLGWGSDLNAFNEVFTNLFIPDGTDEQCAWWQNLERETASPETAALTFEVLQQIDVSDLAPKVNVPTLVLHARNDARVPFEEGQRLAACIPDAQFVPLESANHVLLQDEPAWKTLMASVRAFLPPRLASRPSVGEIALTPAERAVLGMVAKGLGNSDIAANQNKSEKTVRNQVSILFEKFGVHSRAELIVRVLSDP